MRIAHAQWRRLLKRRSSKPSTPVLLYHRVAELESDPQLFAVRPSRFSEHLAILRERYEPLGLGELLLRIRKGTLPSRGVVITFDDGYEDNLLVAKPLLEAKEVPATVFVTSGYVGSGREFWWDELERRLLQPGKVAPVMKIELGAETLSWELGENAFYGEDQYERNRSWNVLQEDDPSSRHVIYRSLFKRLRRAIASDRESALAQLRAQSHLDEAARASHRPLTVEGLRRLADSDLLEIGSHTVTHPVLSALPPQLQRCEIADSRRNLEQLIQRPVRTFSYPFGSPGDIAPETASAVREAGFVCACMNITGRVTHSTDVFRIPRILVRDWEADELAARLAA
jgi:peptidoglycan/xylan/chitin deacetylase (PgdA/CDA1 family)